MELNQQIQEAAQLIRDANHCMAMTGAGISTPSGIPDFRSPDSGVWKQVDPLTVASIHAFRQNPQNFYDWIHPLSKLLITAEPNPAHSALVTLESKGKLKGIITQNIDDLHGKAGLQNGVRASRSPAEINLHSMLSGAKRRRRFGEIC